MLTYIMSCHGLGVRVFEGRIGMQNFEKKFTLVEIQNILTLSKSTSHFVPHQISFFIFMF